MNLKLKAKIVEKYCTQGDFAKEVGISEAFISRIVRQRVTPKEDTKEKIARGLNCKTQDLFPR
jgi:DNA-binding XRE family transcriptional regulator